MQSLFPSQSSPSCHSFYTHITDTTDTHHLSASSSYSILLTPSRTHMSSKRAQAAPFRFFANEQRQKVMQDHPGACACASCVRVCMRDQSVQWLTPALRPERPLYPIRFLLHRSTPEPSCKVVRRWVGKTQWQRQEGTHVATPCTHTSYTHTRAFAHSSIYLFVCF